MKCIFIIIIHEGGRGSKVFFPAGRKYVYCDGGKNHNVSYSPALNLSPKDENNDIITSRKKIIDLFVDIIKKKR